MAATLKIEPATLDIIAQQGKDWVIKVTVKDSAGALTNLNGYSAAWQVRAAGGSASTATISKTSAQGGGIVIASGAVADQITITVPASQTKDVAAGSYAHEIELTEPGGGRPPFVMGRLAVTNEVVR